MPDTLAAVPPKYSFHVPACLSCGIPDQQKVWSFEIGASKLCGVVTDAVTTPDNTAFTFFGPSACSRDTGIIIEAFFGIPFNRDLYKIRSVHASIQYYDNVTLSNVFTSWYVSGFAITVDTFSFSARQVSGRFQGLVTTPKGDTAYITAGKFRTPFR